MGLIAALAGATATIPVRVEAQELSMAEIERLHVEAQRAAAQGTDAGRRDAIALWTRIAEESERRGDHVRQSVALNNIGLVEHARSNHDRALDVLRQAWRIARTAGDMNGQLTAAYNEGRILERLGRRAEALRRYEKALRALDLLPDRKGTSVHADLVERLGALRGDPETP